MSDSTVKVAAIGLIGAIAGGAITNWDKLLPEKRKTETPQVIQREIEAREAAATADAIKVQAEAAKAQAEATKALAEAKRIQIELETKRLEDEKRIAQEAEERRREEVRSRLNAKAKQLASEAAPIIVKKYWMGGSDISSRVESVSYDEGSEEYDIDMRINWFGMIVSSNEYWAEGKLRVARDGSFHFTKTGASSGLRDVEGAMGAMKLGILAGAAGSN